MDPFAVIVLVGVVVVLAALLLLGRYYPGSGFEEIGLRSGREITETREALEAEDLDQMLTAHNARRREEYLADRELDQLLEATNARRRKRGLPDRSADDVRREFGGGQRP